MAEKETRTCGVPAYAKLNLTLDVLGLMPDGYHELCSVMHGVSLHDDVTVRIAPSGGNHVAISIRGAGFERIVPADRRNTAAKAAYAFLDAAGAADCRVEIGIFKRIPVGAGLGGGSADAAAVLHALNALFDEPFDTERLCEIGVSVGADVPFCIRGGTMLARGRGELLSPLPALPNCEIVIVKPRFSVSTAELFRKIDSVKITERPDTEGFVASLECGDLHGAAHRIYNVFEQALPSQQSAEISAIKGRLLDLGALSAAMTGTGSAVFGIFEKNAPAAQKAFWRDYDSFLCGVQDDG